MILWDRALKVYRMEDWGVLFKLGYEIINDLCSGRRIRNSCKPGGTEKDYHCINDYFCHIYKKLGEDVREHIKDEIKFMDSGFPPSSEFSDCCER